jgi:serine/threonine protein kinase
MTLQITANDWKELSPLVDQALELDAAARVRWLKNDASVRALSDAQRDRLAQLLTQSDSPETNEIFDTLPQLKRGAQKTNHIEQFQPSDSVGPYQLVNRIGLGGMSEVWRAKRFDGAYQRDVALKLPYAHASGAAREHFLKRLERERDLLARLEHPRIARFYDAGIAKTPLGAQPYLALEFVEGVPITQYANDNKLDVRARCKLFLQVLEAVQYAHQRLVVHRDLKPSNILVRTNDPMKGEVALLDFGVAKVLDEDTQSGDATQLTREMGRAITLAYASPEQLLGETVTTASDVYSAAVLFYELLHGMRPHVEHERSPFSLLSAQQTSPTPLGNNDARRVAQATMGSVGMRALAKTLRGDLDAITAKALRYEADARYASAENFSADVHRFLENEPVQARAGAHAYVAKKFVRRHRVSVSIAVGGFAAVAIVGSYAINQHFARLASSAYATTTETLIARLLDGMGPDLSPSKTFSAKELLDRTIHNLPTDATNLQSNPTLARIAETYRLIGAIPEAIAIYERLVARSENEGDVASVVLYRAEMSLSYVDEAAIEKATRQVEIADRIANGRESTFPAKARATLHLARGIVRLNTGELDAAARELENATLAATTIEHDRTMWFARIEAARGRRHLMRSDFAAAREAYKRAASHYAEIGSRGETGRLDSLVAIAQSELLTSNFDEAQRLLNTTIPSLEQRFGIGSRPACTARILRASTAIYSGALQVGKAAISAMRPTCAMYQDIDADTTNLEIQEKIYAAEYATAKQLVHGAIKTSDSQSADIEERLHRLKLRRHLAEIALRTNAVVEAEATLLKLREDYEALGEPSSAGIASVDLLLAIVHMKRKRFEQAERVLRASIPKLQTAYGENDARVCIAKLYLAALEPTPLDSAARASLIATYERLAAWQPDGKALMRWFETGEPADRWPIVPVVF